MCNNSGPPYEYGVGSRVILGIFLLILIVLTILGNLVVITSVLIFRKLRSVTNAFVVSLAVADLLVGVLVMPFDTYRQLSNAVWDLGKGMCLVATSFDVMFTTTSIIHLSCLAVDRYLAICHCFIYHQYMNQRTSIILLFLCWTVPLLVSFMPIMNEWHAIGIEGLQLPHDVPACVFIVNKPMAIIGSLVAFYAPTIFMFVCNYRIFQAAKRQAQQIRNLEVATPSEIHHNKSMRHETKAAKTLTIVMGAYCVCWFPFFICNIIDPFINYCIPAHVWLVAVWLGYVNSTINPFLYYFFNRSFRKAFIHLLCLERCALVREFDANGNTTLSTVSE
ncbi:5-hydroxytryptamine receptor 4-like [Tubulanus polymorphus]|uniref:5-hydroxytryptamine receptor 4-like n=1 Tax=Tubulanus polymorphus TaxID=672921 RepID=UPI003DA650CB